MYVARAKKKKQKTAPKKSTRKKRTRNERAAGRKGEETRGGRERIVRGAEKEVEAPGSRETFFREKRSPCEYFRGRAPNPPANTRPHLRAYPAYARARERDIERKEAGEKKTSGRKKSGRACGCAGGVAR